jgi:signal transduction histidine kinase
MNCLHGRSCANHTARHLDGRVTISTSAQPWVALKWAEAELISERNRLGRDVHDVLAHTLGAVSIQLTALDSRIAVGDSQTDVRDRIKAIHRLLSEGLGEARDAVRVLRQDGLPLLARLERLCNLHSASFEVCGDPLPLTPGATLTSYRVTQEALTNAQKHAPGVPVSVRLNFAADAISIRVHNQRPDVSASGPLYASGGGHGLVGMHERVKLVGGSLEAGPNEDGWRVTANIPLQAGESTRHHC